MNSQNVQSVDELVLRNFNYCIIDEVDSILIDEARTPLIISGPAEKPSDRYYKAAKIAAAFERDIHYTVWFYFYLNSCGPVLQFDHCLVDFFAKWSSLESQTHIVFVKVRICGYSFLRHHAMFLIGLDQVFTFVFQQHEYI